MSHVTVTDMLRKLNLLNEDEDPRARLHQTKFNAAQLHKMDYDQPPMLFGDIIPARGVWTLVGSSDTGKSMLLRQLALDVAKGNAFIGWQNKAVHNKSIFVATEDDTASTSFLIKRQSPALDDLENLRFNFEYEDIPLYLHNELSREPADLVIIDAWSDVFGKDLKDSALIRKTLNEYVGIANHYGCSIGFLHHTGKRTEKLEPSKNNILSGQGYEAKMRLVIELRADDENPNLRHLCIVKGNYLGSEHKQASYVLRFDQDSFRFSNTGDRVSFGLLKPGETGSNGRRSISFEEINEGVHRRIVIDIFSAKEKMKYAELVVALGEAYKAKTKEKFSRDKCRQLVNYLIQNDMVQKFGNDRGAWYELMNEPAE